jgi:hypothetical protein
VPYRFFIRQAWLTLISALLICVPAAAQQQPPSQQQVDSMRAQLRTLQLRLDSLLAALSRAPAGQRQDSVAAVDELAALRAAAAAAAGRDTLQADTSENVTFVSRQRSLSLLNPEISATGDIRAHAYAQGRQRNNFDPREFEISLQSALDPYSHTKIFVAFEDGEVDIEEGYVYWTGLPGRLRIDFGKFRQPLGELNRWHLHALPEAEYPLVLQRFAGEDGLVATGASLYWTAPLSGAWGVHEFILQPALGGNELLFEEGGRPSIVGHVNNFWQLTPSTYVQLGATGIYGKNPDGEVSKLGGLDARITWRPPSAALYREWTLRGEVMALQAAFDPATTYYGGFLQTSYRLGQRWILGSRFDVVQEPDGSGTTYQFVPTITMWQSEWVYLRGQYTYTRSPAQQDRQQFTLQAVWAMGPHKHEIY